MSNIKLNIKLIGSVNENTNVVTDSIAVNQEISETQLSEISRIFKKEIANAASDVEILDGVSADSYAMLFCDQEISIKLNGSADSITLKPKSAGTKTPVFLLRGTISSILVTNNSGSVANIDITRIKV